jgi:hypothetical protein
MPLARATSQSQETIESFYRDLAGSPDSVTSSIGRQMLDLLPMLADTCGSRAVWGLTSLYHLWLLAQDDWRSPWLVCVTANPGEGFRVRYRLPAARAPWPDALVEGDARDEAHACQLVAIAIEECGGWP